MSSGRPQETSARGLLFTLFSLLALAGASLALRYAHLGPFGMPVALAIAALKALLVAVFFMEVLAERVAARLALAAGLALVGLLLSLAVADIVTRGASPLGAPPGTASRDEG